MIKASELRNLQRGLCSMNYYLEKLNFDILDSVAKGCDSTEFELYTASNVIPQIEEAVKYLRELGYTIENNTRYDGKISYGYILINW